LYVAYNAPHWPIQALPEDIAKYKGKYLNGWDSTRIARFKLQALGIIDKKWNLSKAFNHGLDWHNLTASEKDQWDTRMAIYAAMIDRMDTCIGQILDKIKALGQEQNTLVFFLSDNGGSADDVTNWSYVHQKNGSYSGVDYIEATTPCQQIRRQISQESFV
jgi:arylsulfatase